MDDRTLGEHVRRTIERRLGDPDLSVEALAASVGMSRSHLHRRLVRGGAGPPGAMIRRARLARATELLRTTEETVGSVARAVGYRDPAHFTRSFKRELGVTPTDWRA